jgi:uncharacterized protein YkwD
MMSATIPKGSYTSEAASATTELLDLVNGERVQRGLKALTLHPTLVQVAQQHADAMRANGFYSHIDPHTGLGVFQRLSKAGYSARISSENIAARRTPYDAHTAWMESPPHRESIVHRDLTHFGVGMSRVSATQVYYVEVFALGRQRGAMLDASTQT